MTAPTPPPPRSLVDQLVEKFGPKGRLARRAAVSSITAAACVSWPHQFFHPFNERSNDSNDDDKDIPVKARSNLRVDFVSVIVSENPQSLAG